MFLTDYLHTQIQMLCFVKGNKNSKHKGRGAS